MPDSGLHKIADAAALAAYERIYSEFIAPVREDLREIKTDVKEMREESRLHALEDTKIQTQLADAARQNRKDIEAEKVDRKDADAALEGRVKEARGPGMKGWGAIIVAIGGAVGAIIGAWKGTSEAKAEAKEAHAKEK